METIEVGPFEFHDKIALKKNYAAQNVRVVPHALARVPSDDDNRGSVAQVYAGNRVRASSLSRSAKSGAS